MNKIVFMAMALMWAFTASAQSELVASYNEGVEALQAKNFTKAVEAFENVIAKGADAVDDAELGCVTNAKQYLPTAYQGKGAQAASAAMKAENPEEADAKFAEAVDNLTKGAAKATEYDNAPAAQKINALLGKVYQAQGATAFNSNDFAKAIEIFAKGYAADPKNTAMALNLAESYFKMDKYEEGMKVCSEVAALPSPKYDEAIGEARAKMNMYTNNQIAKLQQANDLDGIIAMSEKIADKAVASRVAVQAYYLKKDYDKVIELGEAAAALQTDPEDISAVYFNLGSAYNGKEMKDKAVEALKKVTAEPYLTPAKTALAELTK